MKNNYHYGSLEPYLAADDLELPLNVPVVFGNDHPLEVEIGFGTGEYLLRLAGQAPSFNFIGFDQAPKRVIKTLRKIHEAGLSNVRVLEMDAVWGFQYLLMPRSVGKVHCLFPCPWPKKRHAKHRLFQTAVLQLINNRLADGGSLRIVTDHRPYVEWIGENLAGTGFDPAYSIVGAGYQTKFEKKWQAAGQEEFYALDLYKREHVDLPLEERSPVRTYFIADFFPDRMALEDAAGPVTITFKDFIYDPEKKKGMVHALVTEDRRTQYLWVMINQTQKGWCVGAAPGTGALPTEGVRKAVERVYQAAAASTR